MVEDGLTPGLRLFAAIVPPPEVVAAVDDTMSGLDVPGRRVPPENWHVTLRFVGQIDQVAYERWLSSLDARVAAGKLRMALGGLGAFPRPPKATVLWIGVEGDRVADLAADVDDAAVAAGLEAEERPYRPHLTLARVRPPADVRDLVDLELPRLTFTVAEYHVMAAVGGRYRRLETFPI